LAWGVTLEDGLRWHVIAITLAIAQLALRPASFEIRTPAMVAQGDKEILERGRVPLKKVVSPLVV